MSGTNTNSSVRRSKAIKQLGGKCVCCGCTDIRGLEIAHINGNGYQQNKHKGGNRTYDSIARGEEMDKFQVLCRVCNALKYWRELTT